MTSTPQRPGRPRKPATTAEIVMTPVTPVVSSQVPAQEIPVVSQLPGAPAAKPVGAAPQPATGAQALPPDAMLVLLSTLQSMSASISALNDKITAPTPPVSGMAVPDNVQLDLMHRALNSSRPTGFDFQLIIVPEDDHPRVERFATINLLIDRMKAMIGTNCYLFPGVGQLYTMTRGKSKYLQTPFGSFPLFDIDAADGPASSLTGWVGNQLAEVDIESAAEQALLAGSDDADESLTSDS